MCPTFVGAPTAPPHGYDQRMYSIDCPAHLVAQVERQLDLVLRRLRALPTVYRAVVDLLNDPHRTLIIKCGRGRSCRGKRGFFEPRRDRVVICDLDHGPAVLAHELGHAVGGSELDAEWIENLLFDASEGAVPPTPDDYPKFRQQGSVFFAECYRGHLHDTGTGNILHPRASELWGTTVELWLGGTWTCPTDARVQHHSAQSMTLSFTGYRGSWHHVPMRINGRPVRQVQTLRVPHGHRPGEVVLGIRI